MKSASQLFLIPIILILTIAINAQPAQQVMRGDENDLPQSVTDEGKFGGWSNVGLIENGSIFISQSNYVSSAVNVNGITIQDGTEVRAEALDMDVENGRVVLCYQNWDTDNHRYISTFDGSNPSSLGDAVSYQMPGIGVNGVYKVDLENGYLYLVEQGAGSNGSEIHIFDWTAGPNNNAALGSYAITVYDIAVSGNTVYIAGNKGGSDVLQILDVSDKSNPTEQGMIIFGNARNVAVNGNYAYVGCIDDEGLKVVDVSDPANPSWDGTYGQGQADFHSILVEGTKVYGREDKTLRIIDVSNSTNPTLMGEETFDDFAFSFRIHDVENNIIYYTNNGLFGSIDANNVGNIGTGPTLEIPGAIAAMDVDGTNFVTYDYNQNIYAYNIANPLNPTFISKGTEQTLRNIFTHSGYAYIANGNNEIKVYDVDDMGTLLATYNALGEVKDAAFSGNTAYFASDGGFEAVDISNPASPAQLSTANINGTGNAVYIHNNNAFVATAQGFAIVSIANPANINTVSTTALNGEGVGIYATDTYAAIAADNNSTTLLYAYGLTNLSAPNQLKQEQIASASPYVMRGIDEILAVSIPSQMEIKTYVFIEGTNTFADAGAVTANHQIFRMEFFGLAGGQQQFAKAMMARNTTTYYLYGSQESYGMKKIVIKKGGGGEEYTLEVSIMPAEAATNGASVNVTPDQAAYEEGDVVALSAVDGQNGWTFKEYTGDVTSSNRDENITMTGEKKAKQVTANYVQPMLTSSLGTLPRTVFCPDDADGQKLKVMEFTLTANEVDDWLVQALTVSNVGDKHMISQVHLQYPGGELTMNVDSTISEYPFGFGGSVKVPKSSSVTFTLYYTIELLLGDKRCAMVRSAEMKAQVKTNTDVTAIPATYDDGFKAIGAPKTSLPRYIACYENGAGYGYAKLQEAIDSDSTGQADEIWVCNGVYQHPADIYKELEIKAKEKHEAVYEPVNEFGTTFWDISANNVLIDGFYYTSLGDVDITVLSQNSSLYGGVRIRNNKFENASKPIYLRGNVSSDAGEISKNEFINSSVAVGVMGYSNLEIDSNSVNNSTYGFSFDSDNHNNTLSGNSYTNIEESALKLESTNGLVSAGETFDNIKTAIDIGEDNYNVAIADAAFNNCPIAINANTVDTFLVQNSTIAGIQKEDSVIILDDNVNNASMMNVKNTSDRGRVLVKLNTTEGLFNDLRFYTIELRNSKNQTVSNSIFDHVILDYSNGNTIKSNTIRNSDKDGLLLYDSHRNLIESNVISGHALHGIRLGTGWFRGSDHNVILDNTIHSNGESGIILAVSNHNNIKNNRIFRNGISGIDLGEGNGSNANDTYVYGNSIYENTEEGIDVSTALRSVINKNTIKNNGESGIYFYLSDNVSATNNTITGHNNSNIDAGIYFYSGKNGLAKGNVLKDNCTGIVFRAHDGGYAIDNKVSNNWCLFTGVSLYDSDVEVTGNTLSDNRGDGLRLDENSEADVMNNNFLNNEGFQLNNNNSNFNVSASDNFWGGEPTSDLFNGNVDVASWLEDPVRLQLTPETDTLYAVPGTTDTLRVNVNNFVDPSDNVTITVADDNGWLTGQTEFNVNVQDTLPAAIAVEYTPGDEEIFGDIIRISGESQTYGTLAADSVMMLNYQPMLTHITIDPDNISIARDSTIQLTALGLDQYGRGMAFEADDFLWYADNGTIDTTGLFTAPSIDTIAVIGAEHKDMIGDDTPFGQAHISITQNANAIVQINVLPDSIDVTTGGEARFSAEALDANEYDVNFTPVWSATGGTIDDEGLYSAGDVAGEYEVTATDQSGEVIGTAYVLVKNPVVGVEDEPMPTEFAMDQNYPNPFNPSTTLQYALPFESQVKLEIYNILGQRVAVLVNGMQSAGYKQYLWNAGRLASGVYIARLIAEPNNGSNTYVDIKKMILLK